jgi:hypothetical protein
MRYPYSRFAPSRPHESCFAFVPRKCREKPTAANIFQSLSFRSAKAREESAVRLWVAQRFSAAIKPTQNNWRLQPPSQSPERSDAQQVWNGHSCPLPLPLILKLTLSRWGTLTPHLQHEWSKQPRVWPEFCRNVKQPTASHDLLWK